MLNWLAQPSSDAEPINLANERYDISEFSDLDGLGMQDMPFSPYGNIIPSSQSKLMASQAEPCASSECTLILQDLLEQQTNQSVFNKEPFVMLPEGTPKTTDSYPPQKKKSTCCRQKPVTDSDLLRETSVLGEEYFFLFMKVLNYWIYHNPAKNLTMSELMTIHDMYFNDKLTRDESRLKILVYRKLYLKTFQIFSNFQSHPVKYLLPVLAKQKERADQRALVRLNKKIKGSPKGC